MRYGLVALFFAVLLAFTHLGYSQYWLQSGVIANGSVFNNSGISVQIETVYGQNITNGSMAFWVGENIGNGAFIQVGYATESVTGYYPNNCTSGGCASKLYMKKGTPYWFFEFFGNNTSEQHFYGSFRNVSLGINGTFNTYSLVSNGSSWDAYLNGNILGRTSISAPSSGNNVPYVVSEYANTSTNQTYMIPVRFRNFSVYINGRRVKVPGAYSFIGYGFNSAHNLTNMYGIEELNNESNYFEVGSGLPILKNGTVMWNRGYVVNVSSDFGNTSSANYTFGRKVSLSEPDFVYISKTKREVFEGWIGSGFGSYTGNSTSANVTIYGKMDERAVWQLQYFVNVSSKFGMPAGTGWYDNRSMAHLGINDTESYANSSTRYVFADWSTANKTLQGNYVAVGSPLNITGIWKTEYLLNISSQYGKVYGSGWYANHSIAHFSLNFTNATLPDGKVLGFYSWSNGNPNRNGSLEMDKGYVLRAEFKPMVYVTINAVGAEGQNVSFSSINVDNTSRQKNTYLFIGKNYFRDIDILGYKIPLNKAINVTGPGIINLSVSVYSVLIRTRNFYGGAVNASLKLSFSNGTTSEAYSGQNGSYMLKAVPYGMVDGIAVYGNESVPVHVAYGVGGEVSFNYGESYLFFAVILVILAIIAYLTVKHLGW